LDVKEVAMQLTIKAMALNLIPASQLDGDSSKIDSVRDFNAGQIAKFYNTLFTELQKD
jgi:hypothetical protein